MERSWQITWVDSALKDFYRLNQPQQARVDKHLKILLQNPFYGSQVKKLHGAIEGLYRYRVGNLRIVYRILTAGRTVRIIAFGARGDIY